MTLKNTLGKFDVMVIIAQCKLSFWPRFHRPHGGTIWPRRKDKACFQRGGNYFCVCYWNMEDGARRRTGKYLAVCTNKSVCTDLYLKDAFFFLKPSLERLRRFGGRKGKCFSRYEAKRQEVFLV